MSEGGPVYGGTATLGMLSTSPGFDPHKWWNAAAGIGAGAIFERPWQQDPYTGEFGPRLAEAIPEPEQDGTVYTIRLRPGVKFQKGNGELTAEDVKYSWERLMDPKFAAESGFIYTGIAISGLQDYLNEKSGEITGLAVVDPLTLQVTLDHPDSAFIPAFSYGTSGIVPKAYTEAAGFDKFNLEPIGTGSFQLEKLDIQKGARLVKNPDYWSEGVPYLDAVEITFGVDPELSLLRIEKGEQDLMYEAVPLGSIDRIRNDPVLANQYHEKMNNDCQWVSLPTHYEPTGNLDVRKAIAMSIDKEKLVKVAKGLGEAATGGIFSPISRYASSDLAYPYDPAQAKQLLASAGYPNGFDLEFWAQDQPPWIDMGQAIQQDVSQIGINVDFKPKVYDQFVADTNPGPPVMILFAWEDQYSHGSYIFDAGFTAAAIEGGCCNYTHYASQEMDDLIAKAHVVSDEESVQIYKELDKMVTQDLVLWVPLIYPKRADIVSARIQGFEPTFPTGQNKVYERYWVAA